MADSFDLKVLGIDELSRALAEASSVIRKKAVRGALREAAKVFTQSARAAVPVLKAPTKRRSSGTVKKNIVVRNSKLARKAGNEGVFVGVKPLRGARTKKLGKAGANNPNDPYYWSFLEFGTKKMTARPFLRPAADKSEQVVAVFMKSVIPQIEKLNKRASRVR